MDTESSHQLASALRDCGLYPNDAVLAAEAVLAAGGDDAALAEHLFALGVVTSYQQRKIRVGRIHEILFGSFLILDKIGEGGMGKVYRAYQLRVRRMVALKVVRPQLMSNKTVLHRYKREAAAVAALDHPNIVKLHDADEHQGRYYLEMEFIDGIDLARLVKEFGKPPTIGLAQVSEACEYVRQAALGLHQAHEQRLVHRDIKPSNLLVSGHRALLGTDGKAIVKILDMGLVRSLEVDDEDFRADLTRDGTVVGTPDYMSPEQAKNSKTVDGRADLYSLGCTLYYLLKGQPPFAEGNPIEKLLKHQVDPAPNLRKTRPDVPEGVAAIVDRLLQKKPADRYQSAAEVAVALLPYSTAEGVTFAPAAPRSGRMPAPEPFSFTDESTLAPIEPPSSPGVVQPAAPPSFRLRAIHPPAAPAPKSVRAVAVPRAVSAVPIQRPEAPPSSQSLPGASTKATSKLVKAETPVSTTSRPKSKKATAQLRRKPERGAMIYVVAAVVGAAVLLGIAGAVIAFGTQKDSPPQPAPDVVQKPRVEPPASKLVPIREILPERTTAALVIYPRPYWQRVTYQPGGDRATTDALKALAEKTRFDPRTFERGTFAFVGRSNSWIAIGEGSFLTPSWIDKLDELRASKSTKYHNQKVYSFSPWSSGPHHSAVLGGRAYGLSNDAEALGSLSFNATAGKVNGTLPSGVSEGLKGAEADADPPMLTFAASDQWTLPDGTSLREHGIVKATVTARLVGEELATQFVFVGRNRLKMKAFVHEYLGLRLPELYPGVAPIASLVAPLDPVFHETGDGPEMVLSVQIPWKTVRECLEKLLAPSAADPNR